MENIEKCMQFIEQSSTPFQAIETISEILRENGFKELFEYNNWKLEKGNKYFTTRNHTSIIAFEIGKEAEDLTFNICASHSDVCTFKIKPNNVINRNGYVQLNTEGYGGMICSTWMDRPLSIAGRLFIEKDKAIKEVSFDLKEPVCLIPNMAIHINRTANEDMKFNKQVDMLPLMGFDHKEFNFNQFLAKRLNIEEANILGVDGYLYNPQKCQIWGENKEFISGPRLDDLEMAYATLTGFLQAENSKSVNVYCCFDNEEVGSHTRQGAASTFLQETLKRINVSLNKNEDDFYASLARSLMVSADNAHALHPNHPEKADDLNRPLLNKGIVIKYNAAQSYTTDALSAAYFTSICNRVGVPCQTFTNRSDAVGGGTLGNVSTSQVSIASVDIGLAQLAMHSTFETAGTLDIEYCIKALKAFFDHTIEIESNHTWRALNG